MGRSALYASPASTIRSLKRAVKYFKMKAISNLRKIPDLALQRCAVVDIPPAQTKPNLPTQELKKTFHPSPFAKSSPMPNHHCNINKQVYHQNLTPTEESKTRTTKSARRRLPPQPPTENLQWCFQKCAVTGSLIQTV